jgi:hypothetical protein
VTDDSEYKYTTITLAQPWGNLEESVRTFPPCQIKDAINRTTGVTIFIKDSSKTWKRKNIGHYDIFPSDGFIAWDDKNQEYAWHEVGTIDVPQAIDPKLADRSEGIPQFVPIIRGETEPVIAGAGGYRRTKARRRGRFMEWWASLSNSNDTPEFLRSHNKETS